MVHRRAAAFCDRLLGGGDPVVELCLEPLMQIVGFARLLFARGAGNGLGAASGVGKRLFVSRLRGVRPLLQLLRRREIVADDFAARCHDAADAWQRNARHQYVKKNEADRQPDELRRKMLRLERRELGMSRGRFGMGGRFGHNLCFWNWAVRLPRGLTARTATTARSAMRRCRALRGWRSRKSGCKTDPAPPTDCATPPQDSCRK